VGLKLSVIAGLIAALIFVDGSAALSGTLSVEVIDHQTGWEEIRVLLGLAILVQGFETSRYLGSEYDGKLRRRTMITAQIIASLIYVGFIVLATPFFVPLGSGGAEETAIIDLLLPLGIAVAPALILTAMASQLSAAVADLNGAGGLVVENLGRFLNLKFSYMVAIAAALAITWTANIYEIIVYASRAFVLYYALQSLQALLRAARTGRFVRAGFFGAGLVLAVAILLFAVPASA